MNISIKNIIEYFQTSSDILTENYISVFKPSAYARVFGRALVNNCPNIQPPQDPMYQCGADDSVNGHLVLSVSLNNDAPSEILKEKNLMHKSGFIMTSIDSFVYMPFREIDTGIIG